METNYYFQYKIKDTFLEDTLYRFELCEFINKDYISQIKNDLERIHIGKRSSGWKPLFQKTRFYDSMKKLTNFYTEHQDELIIKDEYKQEYTWEELKEELFNWSGKTNLSCIWNDHYLDEDKYEWCKSDFS